MIIIIKYVPIKQEHPSNKKHQCHSNELFATSIKKTQWWFPPTPLASADITKKVDKK